MKNQASKHVSPKFLKNKRESQRGNYGSCWEKVEKLMLIHVESFILCKPQTKPENSGITVLFTTQTFTSTGQINCN